VTEVHGRKGGGEGYGEDGHYNNFDVFDDVAVDFDVDTDVDSDCDVDSDTDVAVDSDTDAVDAEEKVEQTCFFEANHLLDYCSCCCYCNFVASPPPFLLLPFPFRQSPLLGPFALKKNVH